MKDRTVAALGSLRCQPQESYMRSLLEQQANRWVEQYFWDSRGGSAVENSRVTSLPQKVQADFKIEEATYGLGSGPETWPGHLCSEQLKALPVHNPSQPVCLCHLLWHTLRASTDKSRVTNAKELMSRKHKMSIST